MNSDFLSLAHAVATKNLEYANIEFFHDKKSICLILATSGYPDNYPKDTIIKNLHDFTNDDQFYIFHAATKKIGQNILTNGGRVLSLVAMGNTYEECRKKVYQIAQQINWDYKYYRKDIGANF